DAHDGVRDVVDESPADGYRPGRLHHVVLGPELDAVLREQLAYVERGHVLVRDGLTVDDERARVRRAQRDRRLRLEAIRTAAEHVLVTAAQVAVQVVAGRHVGRIHGAHHTVEVARDRERAQHGDGLTVAQRRGRRGNHAIVRTDLHVLLAQELADGAARRLDGATGAVDPQLDVGLVVDDVVETERGGQHGDHPQHGDAGGPGPSPAVTRGGGCATLPGRARRLG